LAPTLAPRWAGGSGCEKGTGTPSSVASKGVASAHVLALAWAQLSALVTERAMGLMWDLALVLA
jgi:hypothetical protein